MLQESTFFLVGFVVYIAFMIVIGIFASRGKSEGTDYLTGGRSLNLLLIFGTIGATMIGTGLTRSEERRVGKECRSRWSPYH